MMALESVIPIAHTLPREIRAVDRWAWNATRFAEVDVPARLLVGSESMSWVRQMTERLASGLRGSEIVPLRGQQHTAMETAPELFVREVVGFLQN